MNYDILFYFISTWKIERLLDIFKTQMLTQNSSDGTHGLLVLTHHEGDVTKLGEMSQEPQVITQTWLVLVIMNMDQCKRENGPHPE